MTYKTQGIILTRKDFFETDRLLTIFTKEFGKLKIIAKGVRKILSKNGGQIELFLYCDFIFAEGKNLDILISADPKEHFKQIRKSLKKTSQAYYLAELIDKFCQENETHPDIFRLFLESLKYLDQSQKPSSIFLAWFSWQLVFLLGFGPELVFCLNCQKRLKPVKNFFNAVKGGVLCENCAKSDKINLPISPQIIKLLRITAKKDIYFLEKLKLENKEQEDFKRIIEQYLLHLAEKDFESKKLLKKILVN